MMRYAFLLPSLLAPAMALAATGYTPKFARDEQQAQVMSFDLCPKPAYPKSSLRNEESGVVALRFTIGADGRLLKQQITRSTGFRDLDRAAQGALAQCWFRPASIKGQPVQSPMDIQYVWTLE
jgi:protein TonB